MLSAFDWETCQIKQFADHGPLPTGSETAMAANGNTMYGTDALNEFLGEDWVNDMQNMQTVKVSWSVHWDDIDLTKFVKQLLQFRLRFDFIFTWVLT